MPRALISVSDKRGVVEFARGLRELGYDLVSTGGTLRALTEAGLPATAVSEVTGFPEILDGRVKTLHPRIHGGVLATASEAHERELAKHGIERFELVVVNLYPFRETVVRPDVALADALEQIDIGGPTLIRAAAKNFACVTVVVDPADYEQVLTALATGTARDLARALARKAFAHTAAYDAAIVSYLDGLGAADTADTDDTDDTADTAEVRALPPSLHLAFERAQELRYGENPHQRAARYREVGSRGFWDDAVQHKGMALSYLNLFDGEAAWRLVHEFATPAVVIVKHANPCGVAVAPAEAAGGSSLADVYERALAGDPKSAFGGVVALNRPVDEATAAAIMAGPKADLLLAPDYAPEALERLKAKRKNMRVLAVPPPGPQALQLRRVDGGLLLQEPDRVRLERSSWRVVSRRQPTDAQWRDLELAWTICAYTSSNAIVLVADGQAVGIGAGQQSRVDAGELAARKAAGRAHGGACASDAFYPFRDGLDAAAAAGVAAVIQPGGSVRDEEVIAAADEHGVAMVFTGRRHFRH